MARLISRQVEPERECGYLPAKRASLDTRVMLDVTSNELAELLVRGWRRFGPVYFRPACAACAECVPIRVPVHAFRPNQSQRRAWRGARDLRIEVAVPSVDERRLALYARWHAMREEQRGWAPSPQDARSYALEFAFPHPAAREITYWDGDELLGVGLSDETTHAHSAIYFFYEPTARHRSLGTVNVLFQLEHAKARGATHLYLGFRVKDCASMRYKAAFRPHELLVGRPAMHETPRWVDGGTALP